MFGVSIACVASVSVGFGSKERPKKGIFGVFPREKWGEHHFSRGAKHENPVSLTFFAPQPHGNACYAGRVQSQNNLIVPHMKNITSLPKRMF